MSEFEDPSLSALVDLGFSLALVGATFVIPYSIFCFYWGWRSARDARISERKNKKTKQMEKTLEARRLARHSLQDKLTQRRGTSHNDDVTTIRKHLLN